MDQGGELVGVGAELRHHGRSRRPGITGQAGGPTAPAGARSPLDTGGGGRRADGLPPDPLEDVGHRLGDGLGVDAVGLVVGDLARPAPLGLPHRGPHRVRHRVGVHDDPAGHVAGRPPHGLDEGGGRPQEPLLVGVEDGDQRHFGQVETLPQQVDADQDVEDTEPQVADELDPGDGVDVGVQVLHADALLGQVLGQVLGHLLGEGGDQHPPAGGHGGVDAHPEVVDLPRGRPDVDLRVDEAGRTDDLFHDVGAVLELPRAGGGREHDGLARPGHELVETQRAVVEGGGQAEAVLHQGLLSGAVAGILAVQLGHGHVALVEHDQEVLGEEVEQGVGGLARGPTVEVTTVILDAGAHPGLGQHLEVELGAHTQPLGLEELARSGQLGQPFAQLDLDGVDGRPETLVSGRVVRVGEDDQFLEVDPDLAGDHVEGPDALDGVTEEFDAHGLALVGGVDLDGVAVDPELAAGQALVVAAVLQVDQPPEQGPLVVDLPGAEGDDTVAVLVGRSQAVDAGHRRHHDGVRTHEQRGRRGVPEPVDLVVDGRVLLDVGVRRGHVRLGLVVVVVGDEVLDSVAGEELLELGGQLGGQRFVGLDDEGRSLDSLDGPGNGGRLARAGDPEEGLVSLPSPDAGHQRGDGLGLVAGRLEGR